jgi:hypothetical protein
VVMTYVLVQHKIGKWAEFEAIYKDEEARRRTLGSKSGAVFRSVDDPHTIFSIHEWDSLEGAQNREGAGRRSLTWFRSLEGILPPTPGPEQLVIAP